MDAQVRPAPQAAAMSGGHGDLRIFVASLLAMTEHDQRERKTPRPA